jgi:hypothetical protein
MTKNGLTIRLDKALDLSPERLSGCKIRNAINMETLPKIFAHFQNADAKGRIRLTARGTIDDLKANNITLREGLRLLLDDGDDLSTIGIVGFSEEENIWVAKIDWDSFCHVLK